MNDPEPRTWVYTRVSTGHQEDSIPAQIEKCLAYIKMTGLTPDGEATGIFRDPAVSGSKPITERPSGSDLMLRVRSGDRIVVSALDRMFRSTADCAKTVDTLGRQGVSLHICNLSGQAVDTSTAMGKFFLDVMGATTELERKQIVKRLEEGRARARARGPVRSRACPFGCKEIWAWTQGGKRRVFRGYTIHESQHETLQIIVRMRRAGHAYDHIRQTLERLRRPTANNKDWNTGNIYTFYRRVVDSKAGLLPVLTIDGRIPGDPDAPE